MASAALARLRRRPHADFSDYLELRRALDAGAAEGQGAHALLPAVRHLEARLPVRFAEAIPHMLTLAPAAQAPPRGLSREAVRAMFAMREEFASHGGARASLMGFELPDADGLKDWLDFVENERRHALQVRSSLRELDRRIWAVYTGDRRMPTTPTAEL